MLRFARDRAAYPALVDVLERRPPRANLAGALEEAALSLDRSYLFIQGPPGPGKTWQGARLAIALMRAGKRVGVTALSHKAIHKFLEDLEEAARRAGVHVPWPQKSGGAEGSRYEGSFVASTGDNSEMLEEDVQLLAGTSFLFARTELDRHLDLLFVDEGGQFALADAIAVGTAARNLVLLGDPNQLPQVSQAAHPPGARASVLEHLLGDDETVRRRHGPLPRGDVAPAPGDLLVRVGGVVREPAPAGRAGAATITGHRERVGLATRRARRPPLGVARGGRGRPRRDQAACRQPLRRLRRK